MLVTAVEQGKGKQYKIYSEREFLFALYGREMKKYHIEEGTELPDHVADEILEQVIYKRARERALYLLESRPYTCFMLADKLKHNDYPKEIVERVVFFLQQYHYLDDSEYVRMYVESYSGRKSRKQLQYDLQRKGITRELIEAVMDEQDYSEAECLKKQFERYTKGKDLQDRAVRQKVFRYLSGKGFSYYLIEELMEN